LPSDEVVGGYPDASGSEETHRPTESQTESAGVAADTGGGIRGNMIDLGYPDGVVSNWTTRWVDIYILGP
jgi:3D (Asp-Asp-Asp) domain-containing protein